MAGEKGEGKLRHLRQQVEQIRDTESGDVHDVIVRMSRPEDQDTSVIRTVAEALRRRGLSTSARDTLPLAEDTIKTGSAARANTKAAQRLRQEDRSLVAQVAGLAFKQLGVAALRTAGLSSLEPLLNSDVVRDGVVSFLAAESPSKRRKRPEPERPIRSFWTSSSAVIKIRDQDLPKLVEEVPQIEDIYPNRRLYLPPVVSPKHIPQAIEDNKVSAWGLRMIGALAAWGAFDARGRDVTVGLLDTGVDADHPDLQGKISAWAEFDDKGNLVPDSTPYDSDLHGTHCAGTIAGGKASGRWIGVAPEAKIAAAMVLNGERGGTDAQVLAGIEWAIEQQVDVISMSLGGLVLGPDVPSTYTMAILNAQKVGIPVVTAIGNEGSQTSGSPGNDFLAFAVGATDHLNRVAGFSGGRTQIIRQSRVLPADRLPLVYSKPDISAPGVAIHSCVPDGKYATLNGTSMATPHVAGAIALLLSATSIRDVPAEQRAFLIQDLLTGSAEEFGEAGQNHRYGFGRLDILRAIGFAKDLGY